MRKTNQIKIIAALLVTFICFHPIKAGNYTNDEPIAENQPELHFFMGYGIYSANRNFLV
jgi:hypothetical protein